MDNFKIYHGFFMRYDQNNPSLKAVRKKCYFYYGDDHNPVIIRKLNVLQKLTSTACDRGTWDGEFQEVERVPKRG